MTKVIIVLLLCLVLYLIFYFNKNNNEHFDTQPIIVQPIIQKPYLWSYWENVKGSRPEYIDLCFQSFMQNCSGTFDIKILDEKSVYDYLPNLRKDINKLKLAHKTDYIRVALLYYYGGLWVDADTIIMNDLQDIINQLNNGWDYIGFGCSSETCHLSSGYPQPSNGVMASKKNGLLMKKCLIALDNKLDKEINDHTKFNYFDLGKIIIWKEIDDLLKTGYNYYHYSSAVDGSRDKDGLWIPKEMIIKKHINLLDESKLMFVFLANSSYCGDDPTYNWFCKKNKQEIINGDYYLSSMFRKALKI